MADQDIDIPEAPPVVETSASLRLFKDRGDENLYAVDALCASSRRAQFRLLLSSGKYSDITIICGGTHFNTHRNLVCTQSRWFEERFASPPKKKTIKTVTVNEDPSVFQYFLEFLYTGTYGFQSDPIAEDISISKEINERLDCYPRCPIPRDSAAKSPEQPLRRSNRLLSSKEAPKAQETNPIIPPNIRLAMDIFLMAEKYEVRALQLLAYDRFYIACKARWVDTSWNGASWEATQEFEEVVLEVYTSTKEVDTPLWRALCKLIVLKKGDDMMKKRMAQTVHEQYLLNNGVAGYMLQWSVGN